MCVNLLPSSSSNFYHLLSSFFFYSLSQFSMPTLTCHYKRLLRFLIIRMFSFFLLRYVTKHKRKHWGVWKCGNMNQVPNFSFQRFRRFCRSNFDFFPLSHVMERISMSEWSVWFCWKCIKSNCTYFSVFFLYGETNTTMSNAEHVC